MGTLSGEVTAISIFAFLCSLGQPLQENICPHGSYMEEFASMGVYSIMGEQILSFESTIFLRL